MKIDYEYAKSRFQDDARPAKERTAKHLISPRSLWRMMSLVPMAPKIARQECGTPTQRTQRFFTSSSMKKRIRKIVETAAGRAASLVKSEMASPPAIP